MTPRREADMGWIRLTSVDGHSILLNLANVLSVEPYQDPSGANSRIISIVPDMEEIRVMESIDEITSLILGR
jgi:hypothetical protein